MNRPSNFQVIRLFVQLAFRRFNKHANTFSKFSKRPTNQEDPSNEAKDESAAPSRGNRGTHVPARRGSRAGQLAILVLSMLMLMGAAMFSAITMLNLIAVARVNEMAAAGPASVIPEDYAQLEAALQIQDEQGRKEATEKAIDSICSHIAAEWLVKRAKEVLRGRFEEQGISGFQSSEPEAPWRGDLALLSGPARARALRAAGLCLVLVNLSLACSSLALRNSGVSRADPELLWLFQFPVSRRILFLSRLAEHWVGNLAGPVSMIASWVVLACCGYGFVATVLIGLVLGASASLGGAALCLMTEIWLIQRCSRKMRGAIVGGLSAVGGIGILYGMFFTNAWITTQPLYLVADWTPAWCMWTPFSLGWGAIATGAPLPSVWWLASPLSACGLAFASVTLASRWTAHGIGGGLDSARTRDRAQPRFTRGDKVDHATEAGGLASWFRGLAWKEMLQLRRQPETLLQVLLAPVLIGFLLYMRNPGYSLTAVLSNHGELFCGLFAGASYMLLVSGCSVLRNELGTLWLLQSQPRSLADCIRTKARVWGVIAGLVSLSFLVAAVAWGGLAWNDLFPRVYFLIAGLWLFAEVQFGQLALGATIGEGNRIQFRWSSYLLPGFLSFELGTVLYTGNVWSMLGVLVILGVASIAVRDRGVAELPWLTEPVERPAKRIDVLHGLVALLVFMNLQALARGILIALEFDPVTSMASAYMVAALIASLVAVPCFRRVEWSVPKLPLPAVWRVVGFSWLATCVVGFGWALVVANLGLPHDQSPRPDLSSSLSSLPVSSWLSIVMGVIAAPLFEEIVFRGLLYRTLRRTWSASASLAVTAALFAAIHPASGVLPILLLGVVTAWAAERTGRLWPAILIHMGYNAVIMMLWAVAQ